MKSKARFLPLLVVLSLLISVFLVMPGFAATGTLALDKSFVTSPDGTLAITLTDADLNVGVSQVAETTDYSGALYTQAISSTNPVGSTFFDRVKKFPILDANGDGIVNFQDVTVSIGSIDVLALDPSGGLVTFVVNTSTSTVTPFTVTYTTADVQTHTVKVISTQDSTGFNVTLEETGADTGVFTGTLETAAEADATNADDPGASPRPAIKALPGDVITVSYADASPAGTHTATATVVDTN